MKRILIFKEKYTDRFFDASSDENTSKAFEKIFKERNEDGWFGEDDIEDFVDIDGVMDYEGFLSYRSDEGYEYESFRFEFLEEI